MTIQQISVFLENRAGQLAEITKILADNGIDLRALSIAETADYGVLRMIVDDPKRATGILLDSGYIMSLTPVLAVSVPDRMKEFEALVARRLRARRARRPDPRAQPAGRGRHRRRVHVLALHPRPGQGLHGVPRLRRGQVHRPHAAEGHRHLHPRGAWTEVTG